MKMQINAQKIRQARVQRAWSQEHLANLSGLGLRTIARIENTGFASYDSINALASVLSLDTNDLVILKPVQIHLYDRLCQHRLKILLLLVCLAMFLSPPRFAEQAVVLVVLWAGFETLLVLAARHKGRA